MIARSSVFFGGLWSENAFSQFRDILFSRIFFFRHVTKHYTSFWRDHGVLDLSREHRNQVWFNLTYTIDWLIKIERRIFLAASFLKWFAWSMLFRSFSLRLIEYSFLNRFSTCITFSPLSFPFLHLLNKCLR